MESLNQALFLQINAGANVPGWLVSLAIAIADLVIYVVPLILLIMWLSGNQERRSLAIKAFLVAMLGVGIVQLIGMVWEHPRPFMIGLGRTLIPHAPDSSFPSDHATVLFAVSLTLLLGRVMLVGLSVLFAGIIVAWARIFLGVHFPFDMIGAAGVAAIAYVIVYPLWRLFGAKITIFVEIIYRKVMAKPIAMGFVRR